MEAFVAHGIPGRPLHGLECLAQSISPGLFSDRILCTGKIRYSSSDTAYVVTVRATWHPGLSPPIPADRNAYQGARPR
jgi:hypothetical protein